MALDEHAPSRLVAIGDPFKEIHVGIIVLHSSGRAMLVCSMRGSCGCRQL
jgi:hypothetical protein